MKLQKTNSVKNFRPTIESRLLKEKTEKQGLKKRTDFCSRAPPRKDKDVCICPYLETPCKEKEIFFPPKMPFL